VTGLVHDVEQRSDAWAALRLGRLCASRSSDMMAVIGKGEAASRRHLRTQLVLERLTGKSQENGYVSPAMLQGIEREADALAKYEAVTGIVVQKVGFISHPTLMAGGSPDGVVGDFVGLVEAKAPLPATHLEYLKTGKVPDSYMKQVVHLLWLTGAEWCDWFSYGPEFPDTLQVKVVRVTRNEADIAAYELCVRQFLGEVDRELDALASLAGVA
jgi:hypothetical protein